MLQRGEYPAHLPLILGFAVKLFGRRCSTEKREKSLVPYLPLLTPQFVNGPAYTNAVKPACGIPMMCLGRSHELPEHICGQFLSAAGIIDDSGDDTGNSWVVKMKQLRRIRTSGWGDDIRKRMAFRVHTNKTLSLSKM